MAYPRSPQSRVVLAVGTVALVAIACTPSQPVRRSVQKRPTAPSPAPSVSPSLASNIVWVAAEIGRRVVQVNVDDGRLLETFAVRGRPHNLTVAADGTVIVTLQRAGRIAIIRGDRIRHVRLGGSPHDVKIAGRMAVVTNEGAARLDLVTLRGRVEARIPLRANPHDVAVSPAGTVAWGTLDGTDEIAVVSLRRREVLRYFSTGERPHDVLFAPDGRRVWITDWDDGIHVYSRGGALVKTIPRGAEPHHLAFTPDGDQVWITDHGSDRVLILSTRALRPVAGSSIGGAPHHLAITPDGKRAVIANHDRGTLVVFDVATRRPIGTIAVGAGPHGVWAVPEA